MRVIVSRGFRTLVSLSLAVIYSRALVCLYNYHTSTLLSYEVDVWLPNERREPFVLLVQSYFITLHYSNLAGMDIFSYVRVYVHVNLFSIGLATSTRQEKIHLPSCSCILSNSCLHIISTHNLHIFSYAVFINNDC